MVDGTAQEEATLTQEEVEQFVLGRERQWLDGWAAGDPLGCLEILADDGTYFDFGAAAKTRLYGIEEIRNYLASFAGKIPSQTYELVDFKGLVQGDIAIATLRYDSTVEGKPENPW